MGKFLESERQRYVKFKAESPYFSDVARTDGLYKRKLRSCCLHRDHAEENLFPEVRPTALAFFAAQEIKWHDGQDGKPSNHLCDSQVCCVNFLFPFADKPVELADILRPVFPALHKILPIEKGQFVTFEWIGQQNYLCEIKSPNRKRSRGALFTSADAAVLFERTDGKRQLVLIEWKYTESYGGASLKTAKSGRNRTKIYQKFYESADSPIAKDLLLNFDSLFYEPFYQLMRQQFLAHEMERAQELGANIVSVLHIAPAHNADFQKITSRELATLGATAIDVWKKIVRANERFISVNTEQLFGSLSTEQLPTMPAWLNYIGKRYSWLKEGSFDET